MSLRILVIVLFFCFKTILNAQVRKVESYSTPEIDGKVEKIMGAMTMEEKIAQITGTRLKEIMVDGKVSLEKYRQTDRPSGS